MDELTKRRKELTKAIKQIGWDAVARHVKSDQDKQLLKEIRAKLLTHYRIQEDKQLKKLGIKF